MLRFSSMKLHFSVAVLSLLISVQAFALTTVQTSTSLGVFRNYQQSYQYPLFHSWSLHGFYSGGVETSVDFLVNNDFSQNQWKFFPTQMLVEVPFQYRWSVEGAGEKRSRLQIGRQLLTEGFDLQILDGVKIPYYVNSYFGVAPYAGVARSPDMQDDAANYTPTLGVVTWVDVSGYKLRGGYVSREADYSTRLVHGAFMKEWSEFIFSPQFYAKGEWAVDPFAFSQATSELSLALSDSITGRLSHSYLRPRQVSKNDLSNFIYRIFSVSPTETLAGDLNWQASDNVGLSIGGQQFAYNSGLHTDYGDRFDLGAELQSIFLGTWSLAFTQLSTYAGTVNDFGVRYSHNINENSRYHIEYDLAYVDKVNLVKGWLQHARTGYEKMLWERVKTMFFIEAERNSYYEFDLRSMVYVTNYL